MKFGGSLSPLAYQSNCGQIAAHGLPSHGEKVLDRVLGRYYEVIKELLISRLDVSPSFFEVRTVKHGQGRSLRIGELLFEEEEGIARHAICNLH